MRAMTCGVLLGSPLVAFMVFRRGVDGYPADPTAAAVQTDPDEYTKQVSYSRADQTLVYGDAASLRGGRSPLLDDADYRKFVESMPIVCVDVLLTREDGSVLLVKRHSEPVRGLFWFPGGRLLMRETFFEAARRKLKKEVGLRETSACRVLGTWNTLFQKSAWGGPTQTVNVLVHVKSSDRRTTSGLHICGDQRGRCGDGDFGSFKWVSPDLVHGEDTYILEGLAKLRESTRSGAACDT